MYADELESLLREKSGSVSSPPETEDRASPATLASSLGDFGMLPPTDGMMGDNGSIDLSTYYPHANGDSLGGLDYSFTDNNSLGHLAGIASMMDTSPPLTAQIASTSTSSTDSQNGNSHSGLNSTSPPNGPDLSILYLSWPSNIPDIVTTRHL